jgi:hypothetical protein
MQTIKQAPTGGQDPDTSALCWSDPEATRPWLASVQSLMDDALAAIQDQMLPLRQRRLGHLEAARIIAEATAALAKAYAHAERGLPPGSPTG